MLPALTVAPVAVVAIFVGVPFLLVAAWPVWRWMKWLWHRPLTPAFDPWTDRPEEPGWTEALGEWGPYRFGRAFSFNDHVFKVDAMARRGELDRIGD